MNYQEEALFGAPNAKLLLRLTQASAQHGELIPL